MLRISVAGARGLPRWAGMALILLLVGCTGGSAPAVQSPAGVERLRVEVLATYPHDPAAFTQGLELRDGVLYEGTGRYGASDMRTVEPESGQVTGRVPLPDTAFGEGITIVGDQLWQLTWREGFAFRRDRGTLSEIERVPYTGEGWGVCYDPVAGRLVMSDGTDKLTFRDPETFEARGTVAVTLDSRPLDMINELECVDGAVWANVWRTDQIVRVDPDTGRVGAVVDADGLLSESERDSADVLNGIAAVPDSESFLITGKLWPTLFLVQFVPAE